ncbi:MAG: hypothetical protein QXN46_00725, partial [Candidatus Woesearchaeota archaeon]
MVAVGTQFKAVVACRIEAFKYSSKNTIKMAIIGFGFNKIVVEKNAPVRGKISISNNISITGVEKIDLSLGPAKGKGAKFSFEFKAAYEPKIALISLNGELVYFDKPER